MVHIQGALDPGDNPPANSVAFTLPEGYRPTLQLLFPGLEGLGPNAEGKDCRLTLFEDGKAVVSRTATVGSCHMNTVSFRTS